MQINKYIAHAGVCSRRKADELVQAGEIRINGTVVTDVTYRIKPGDEVVYRDTVLTPEPHIYIVLNKPKGYITTAADEKERKTVLDLFDAKDKQARFYPVGRLDRMTTGVLILTNDGEFSQQLAHPRNKIVKQYKVTLDRPIDRNSFERLIKGVRLVDGFIKPDRIVLVEGSKRKELILQLHSGKNRIIRRLFEHVGYKVKALDRFDFAGLSKQGLKRGEWRDLTAAEVEKLRESKKRERSESTANKKVSRRKS